MILSRKHCYEVAQNIFVKDLSLIDKSPRKIFLVDNCAYSYAFQPDNGIPILSYHEGINDKELLALEQYLILLAKQHDPQSFNKKYFKTQEIFQCKTSDQAVDVIWRA